MLAKHAIAMHSSYCSSHQLLDDPRKAILLAQVLLSLCCAFTAILTQTEYLLYTCHALSLRLCCTL